MAGAQRYFDDLEIGDVFHSFARTLTEAEIIDFAWVYDPQPFHISAEGGAQSMFGAIIASGLQTLAIASRLGLEATGILGANVAGRGLYDLTWKKPVFAGDSLRVQAEVIATRAPRADRDFGDVRIRYQGFNQDNEMVLEYDLAHLVRRRPAA